ncbi:MAG: 16S rRNA (cytidine(1402)-2'-O)-methyltransferase [Campylobacteraceae bacterium]|nr:16S rRNA (cytidine(1402)-2'-O)-methyltransferase [Campylobacteraceae bacterium]
MVYLIPTPIGNLDDISVRSLKLLAEMQILLCEDTRVTKKLLNLLSLRHNIKFKIEQFISVHSHNDKKVLSSFKMETFSKNIAFMSDAGMPCVSDPGASLVQHCQKNSLPYEVLPGANAVLLAYASSGFESSQFNFFGFLPHKGKDRDEKLSLFVDSTTTAILYESVHRILKLSQELARICPNRKLFAIKEATKKFEKKFFAFGSGFPNFLENIDIRGEWAIVLEPKPSESGMALSQEDIKMLDIQPKQKAKLLSKMTGKSIKECYDALCDL